MRKSAGLMVGATAATLIVMGGVAAAGPERCSGWGTGGWAVDDLKACVTLEGSTASGRGLRKPGGPTSTSNAVMWVQVYDLDRSRRINTHMGSTVITLTDRGGLQPGRYQVDYYRGDGKGVQHSLIPTGGIKRSTRSSRGSRTPLQPDASPAGEPGQSVRAPPIVLGQCHDCLPYLRVVAGLLWGRVARSV